MITLWFLNNPRTFLCNTNVPPSTLVKFDFISCKSQALYTLDTVFSFQRAISGVDRNSAGEVRSLLVGNSGAAREYLTSL